MKKSDIESKKFIRIEEIVLSLEEEESVLVLKIAANIFFPAPKL